MRNRNDRLGICKVHLNGHTAERQSITATLKRTTQKETEQA